MRKLRYEAALKVEGKSPLDSFHQNWCPLWKIYTYSCFADNCKKIVFRTHDDDYQEEQKRLISTVGAQAVIKT